MKKRILRKIAALSAVFSMLLSVGTKAQDGKPVKLDESQWTTIYLDYLNGLDSDNGDTGSAKSGLKFLRAELIYLNYDDIPEILLQSDQDEQGGLLLSIEGSEVSERDICNVSSMTDCYYLPHSNLIRIVEKKSRDYSKYDEEILSTKDGKLELLFRGGYDSGSFCYYDEKGEQVPVSSEEFWDLYDEVYGFGPQRTIRGYSYSLKDLTEEFEKRREKFLADKKDKKETPGWRQLYLDYLRNLEEDGTCVCDDNLIFCMDIYKTPVIILHIKDDSDYYSVLTTDGKYLMEKRIKGNGLCKVSTENQTVYFYGESDSIHYDKVFKLKNGFITPKFDGTCREETGGNSSKNISKSASLYEANGISMSEEQYSNALLYQYGYSFDKPAKRPYSFDDLISLLEESEPKIPDITWIDDEEPEDRQGFMPG
ncbi:MAG: hypothetical protein K5770_10445 [Lachnospiraceae bacterium]|nr:hypothetical protein [Lachnospiraceae bacterium]